MSLKRLSQLTGLIRKHPSCNSWIVRRSLSTQHHTRPIFSNLEVNHSNSIFSPIITVQQSLQLRPNASDRLKLQGWITSTVKLKKQVGFFHLTDGLSNHKIQIVLTKEAIDSLPSALHYGSYVICSGTIVESKGSAQNTELLCDKLEFSSPCSSLPFNPKSGSEDNWDTIRQHQHLRAKSQAFVSLLRIRSRLNQIVHRVMKKSNFFNVATPIITNNDCEGGGEVFQVKTKNPDHDPYFKTPVYLTVSGQLHLESVALGIPNVYTLSNCFRSEYSLSRRHLCEFSMLEVEQAYLDSLPLLMDHVERLCKTMAKQLYDECAEDLSFVQKDQPNPYIDKILNAKYLRLTYAEALDLVQRKGKFEIENGANFNTTHEAFLLQHFNQCPLFITHFPFSMKPFYMLVDLDRALNFDLLFPVCGEVCGGSLREHRAEVIKRKFEDAGFGDNFNWYKELRQYGSVPHGGFGIGLDRFLQPLVNLSNIRDVVTFPRWLHHCAN